MTHERLDEGFLAPRGVERRPLLSHKTLSWVHAHRVAAAKLPSAFRIAVTSLKANPATPAPMGMAVSDG